MKRRSCHDYHDFRSKAAAKVDSLNAMLIYQKEFLDESLIDSLYDEVSHSWIHDRETTSLRFRALKVGARRKFMLSRGLVLTFF